MKKAKQIFNISILFSVVLAIISIIMIINPGVTLDAICKVLAVYTIIKGIYLIIMNFKDGDIYLPFEPLIPGVISLIMGIVLFMNPNYLQTIAGILIGIWIILESLNDISVSWKLRKTDAPWILTLIISVISVFAGVYLLLNPMDSVEAFMMWSGIILLINSVTTFVDKIIFKKYAKQLEKTAKEFIKNID